MSSVADGGGAWSTFAIPWIIPVFRAKLSGFGREVRGAPYCRDMGRSANLSRTTKETSIEVALDLDGTGRADVQTPLPFLTHMVEQLARHGLVDLVVRAKGDVEIDGHHTTEDLALVIGQCVAK